MPAIFVPCPYVSIRVFGRRDDWASGGRRKQRSLQERVLRGDTGVEDHDGGCIRTRGLQNEVRQIPCGHVFEEAKVAQGWRRRLDLVNAVGGRMQLLELVDGQPSEEVDVLRSDELIETVQHADATKLPGDLAATRLRLLERSTVSPAAHQLEPVGTTRNGRLGPKPGATKVVESGEVDRVNRSDRTLLVAVHGRGAVLEDLRPDPRVVGKRVHLLPQVVQAGALDVEEYGSCVLSHEPRVGARIVELLGRELRARCRPHRDDLPHGHLVALHARRYFRLMASS